MPQRNVPEQYIMWHCMSAALQELPQLLLHHLNHVFKLLRRQVIIGLSDSG
jgi:hypothetical protein